MSVADACAAVLGTVLLGAGAASALAEDGRIEFRHVLDDSPISFDYRPEQTITPAVEEFHRSAENPYRGDAEAITAGKKIYDKTCKACHLADGTGRIGPNIVDDKHVRPRTDTDRGVFEILYAGGAGAMQAFGQRMDQDALLQVMAYLDELKTQAE